MESSPAAPSALGAAARSFPERVSKDVETVAADDLLRQQAELQAEAGAVESDLRLEELLTPLGEVNRVGSAALGLMVWRDLDLTVVCTKLALEPVSGRRLSITDE